MINTSVYTNSYIFGVRVSNFNLFFQLIYHLDLTWYNFFHLLYCLWIVAVATVGGSFCGGLIWYILWVDDVDDDTQFSTTQKNNIIMMVKIINCAICFSYHYSFSLLCVCVCLSTWMLLLFFLLAYMIFFHKEHIQYFYNVQMINGYITTKKNGNGRKKWKLN